MNEFVEPASNESSGKPLWTLEQKMTELFDRLIELQRSTEELKALVRSQSQKNN